MDTSHPNVQPVFPAWTEKWPRRWRVAFGGLAFLPTVLLFATFALGVATTFGVVWPVSGHALPILVYTQVGTQFITLLVFGHLMVDSPKISGRGKLLWAAGFIVLAPAIIPLFWWMHIFRSPELEHHRAEAAPGASLEPEVHVYDYDYEAGPDHPRPEGAHRREDGAIVHDVG